MGRFVKTLQDEQAKRVQAAMAAANDGAAWSRSADLGPIFGRLTVGPIPWGPLVSARALAAAAEGSANAAAAGAAAATTAVEDASAPMDT